MIAIIRQIFQLLSPAERVQVYWCFLAMLLMAIVDVIGVASIMPFIAVVSDPEAITHHAKIAWLYNKLNFTSPHSFLIFLGFVVLGVLIVGNTISMLTTWAILRFTYTREFSFSKRLFIQYIYQPYVFFLNHNTSELSRNILSEVITVINRALIPSMQLMAKLIVTFLILLLLLVVDPVLAFVVVFMLGGTYAAIYIKVRSKLSMISKRCLEDNRLKYKIVTETYSGIKDIKLLGRENYFIKLFTHYAKQHADDEAAGNIISQLPRFALETIAFGGVLLVIIYLLIMHQNITNAMPLLALYAFASLRLMPALQQIFTSLAFLRMSKEALGILSRDLNNQELSESNVVSNKEPQTQLNFQNKIELRNIHFSYNNSHKKLIQSLNLKIPAFSTVGFVGITGAGKTTTIDLILGLLTPEQGEILVDSKLITKSNMASWQNKIGYVPQNIFLADDTIISNIAFGIPAQEVDLNAIERAARMANIHNFIINELENGYQTLVGDRGIRLSGGQRQRIGIARALYHDPEILVLDEATNSLDTLTEDVILEAIHELTRKKTIIIIAHRISTLQECDMIFVLKDGKIIASDTYQALLKSCAQFQNMAKSNSSEIHT